MTGLTNLIELYFEENSVSDLTPLVTNTGLGTNTEIDVRGNPLNYPSIYTHIPTLQARGAYVDFNNRTPTAPVKISGDTQQGSSGTALAQPFVVEVRDGDSTAFAGAPVTFAVTAGGGTLSVTSTTTDANGRAQSTLTLGNTAGTNTVRVSVQGASQVATFTAVATTTNTAPTFTEGTNTTRTIEENTATGVNIGSVVAATDTDNDTLTYTLGGTDASSFSIVSSSGQLQTQAALDYETKFSYAATVSVSDGNGGSDSITVTINVTDVNEQQADMTTYEVGDEIPLPSGFTTPRLILGAGRSLTADNGTYTCVSQNNCIIQNSQVTQGTIEVTTVAANTAPTFAEGTSTTRSVAENTAANINIGTAIGATDADNDTLTYTLSGTDAASFNINSSTGQLQTSAALDYEAKSTYTVTITVSDDSLTDTITVTINVTNVAETQTNTGVSNTGVCEVGDILAPGESCTYPGTDATFSVLDNGQAQWNIPDLPPLLQWINQTSISGSLSISTTINGETYHFVAEELSSGSWEIKEIGDSGTQQPDPPEQPQPPVTESDPPTLSASTAAPLTEATLHEGVVTLTLNDGTYEQSSFSIRNAITLSGIDGVTVGTFGVDRVSDTEATVELEFNGNISTDSTLTFTVESGAIADYDGDALTTQIPVTAVTESLAVSTTTPLAEATLDESVVTLTLNGRFYEQSSFSIRDAVTVSGINGVTVGTFDVDRVSDTQVTVELTFSGDFDTDATLTITVEAGAIAGYDGSAFTAQIPVTAGTESLAASTVAPLTEATLDESVVTFTLTGGIYEQSRFTIRNAITLSGVSGVTIGTFGVSRISDTEITVELVFNGNIDTDSTLTFTLAASAIANYDGSAFTAQIPVTAGTESLVASTETPLTEATLDENVITLTLTGRTYEQSSFSIRDAVTLSGIDGVTVGTFGIDRVSDTEVTVELTFAGDFDTDATLTFTVEAGAIAGYGGTAFTAQIPVTAGTESLAASTVAPLTEATLDESVVTLTLSGRVYEQSSFSIRDAVTVSGITGVTVGTSDIDRVSDTQVTVELTFNGNINTDSTLTFTVGADAIVGGYNGSALTAQVSVSAGEAPEQPQQPEGVGGTPTLSASTAAPLTEATLDESVVTLTLSGRTYEQSNARIRTAVTISGIAGVTARGTDIDRVSDTTITVELTFDGNINTDGTLTFTVGARAIADYNGSPLTTQIPVTAVAESVVATTAAPLTEATLDESVVTLTLNSRSYENSRFTIRDAVTVSGIAGVTVGTFDVDRVSDTQVTVELTFDGTNFDTNSTITFTVGAGAIAGYDGAALTAQVPVTATVQVLRAPSGISLIHVPLRVNTVDGAAKTIESVGDLYDALGGMNTVNFLITYDPETQGWRSYLGESSRGTSADTVLTDNQGIIADMKAPVSLHLDGDALGSNGSSSITLHPGTNLVGIPLRDSRITRVSDLLALDGIGGNVPAVTILNDGTFQTVEQAGDAGDIPITGGQSFILNAWEETTVAISGQGWDNVSGIAAAAPMKLTGIEVGDTTPILALTGSIVSPAGGWGRIPHLRLGSGLRVIVKNLSTGRAVSTERRSAFPTVTGDEGVGYQLTVVETETGQAARIGDILEISVRSPNPLIGVQPLRYTVTAEDVRRSRIQLPELTVYEIPAETELLRNYPNPFNPETWIPYRLAEDAFVTLTIYDTAGQVVRSIDVGYKPAAAYESRSKAIYWDGRNDFSEQVASGVYFYHLSTGDFSATRKMLILK